MYHGQRVNLIIPALNEAETIAAVLGDVDRTVVDSILVVDNGSTDATADRAAAAGAIVLSEPRRGYGSACLKALAEGPAADLLVFLDADGSDDPTEIGTLLATLVEQPADLVIGSRVLGQAEAGALTPLQRFGNALTCSLVRLSWGKHYTDLGPFRAIRRDSLERLSMSDPDFGWTIEMQVKAAQQGLKVVEVPVRYRRRRGGKSKVSGTVGGSWRAGKRILGYVLAAKGRELFGRGRPDRDEAKARLLVFTRFPEPGKAKTRLIEALGPDGAADLHRRLAEHAITQARAVARDGNPEVEVWFEGGDTERMRRWLGKDLSYHTQPGGDLGARMARAIAGAFRSGADRVVIIGSDCPDLLAGTVHQAFRKLGEADLVLGPAADGGYYLIGLTRPVPDLFRDIPWGSDRVLAETVRRAGAAGLKVARLAELADVDRPEDLVSARRFLNEKPKKFS